MIKIATAECFTHGKIGMELHALAQDYEGNFGCEYVENPETYGDFDYNELSVTCSLFIPTIEAVSKILNVENPPKPKMLIKGIKVYDESGDKKVSKIMAQSVKDLSDCDIAIGTKLLYHILGDYARKTFKVGCVKSCKPEIKAERVCKPFKPFSVRICHFLYTPPWLVVFCLIFLHLLYISVPCDILEASDEL